MSSEFVREDASTSSSSVFGGTRATGRASSARSSLLPQTSSMTTGPDTNLFTQDGNAVKFFIQRDTGEAFVQWLSTLITEHGGQVVDVVPQEGYVLIDPDSLKGRSLMSKWSNPEKPKRFVLCFTFVRASIVAGEMLEPVEMHHARVIFQHEGSPVQIWLHPAIDKATAKRLAIQIEKAGGLTETTEYEARVIVTPSRSMGSELYRQMKSKYRGEPDKFIEKTEWVERSLLDRVYQHTASLAPQRTRFSVEDDVNLINYIAMRVPIASYGGRCGFGLYQELCDRVSSKIRFRFTWRI
ncbi:uncharacterized protein EI90DRAFT_3051523 [Cantharellus anzutake]|uniref:uncharacterized protein n=1 Tax=Cantharellus anzutake TaxID=1750568 RepID=UPI00190311BC|nr:uncharacterized protein EI90DRAFT_3051523 [Cantharellus anzutake]KAF8334228.1 hypothetical protein EI90DRAFT_3051523 [Cantharellus anzutake]